MNYPALKRLAVLLSGSDYYLNGKDNAQKMRDDFMLEVVSNVFLSVKEKTELLGVMMYGPENDENVEDKNEE